MKRRKKRALKILLTLINILLLAIIAVILYTQLYLPRIKKNVTMEAGSKMVDVSEFILNDNLTGEYVTDLKTLDLNQPGNYDIEIKVRNKVYHSTLKIVDTIPPDAKTVNRMIAKGDTIEADDFITEEKDASKVKASFKNKPDFNTLGEQNVTIILYDTSGNVKELEAKLAVLDINKKVQIEAGTVMDLNISDFVNNPEYDASFAGDMKEIDINKPSVYDVPIKINQTVYTAFLEVVDTTAPTGTAINHEIWKGETIEAKDFVTDITDATLVTVDYKSKPDFDKGGNQAVELVLTDSGNNTTELEAVLSIKVDKEAPVIYGVLDKTVFIGDPVSYKKDVVVTDNKDQEVELKVDNSAVNMRKEGVYPITYSAVDSSGNSVTKTANITVKPKSDQVIDEAKVYELADQILNEIITGDMTKKEKAYQIYLWSRNHISYNGDSDKTDWLKEAYNGFKNGTGDCFTFYAVSQALLNRVGIDNMRVTRVGGRTKHFWSLVNCGDGWYHFDTCLHKDHLQSFMLTDEEAEELTKIRGNNYYVFDTSLYPETPKEKFKMD